MENESTAAQYTNEVHEKFAVIVGRFISMEKPNIINKALISWNMSILSNIAEKEIQNYDKTGDPAKLDNAIQAAGFALALCSAIQEMKVSGNFKKTQLNAIGKVVFQNPTILSSLVENNLFQNEYQVCKKLVADQLGADIVLGEWKKPKLDYYFYGLNKAAEQNDLTAFNQLMSMLPSHSRSSADLLTANERITYNRIAKIIVKSGNNDLVSIFEKTIISKNVMTSKSGHARFIDKILYKPAPKLIQILNRIAGKLTFPRETYPTSVGQPA